MPGIRMYMMHDDVAFLSDWLNQEDEIAFLLPADIKKWIAREQHDMVSDIGRQQAMPGEQLIIRDFAEFLLWHIPAGPLPMPGENPSGLVLRENNFDWATIPKIPDPWKGWADPFERRNPRIPYFGPCSPETIRLEISLIRFPYYPLSAFSWSGDDWNILGRPASPSTELFWLRLETMISSVATLVPQVDEEEGGTMVYAFPNALRYIRNLPGQINT
jgi:hypothetical protein